MVSEFAPMQPPVAYVPCTLDADGAPADIRLVQLADGRVALLGYTALDRFMACCGEDHPWALYETSGLADLRGRKPFDVAWLDLPLPPAMRVPAPPESGPTS